jgi:hypothetical protein
MPLQGRKLAVVFTEILLRDASMSAARVISPVREMNHPESLPPFVSPSHTGFT